MKAVMEPISYLLWKAVFLMLGFELRALYLLGRCSSS
jgi:hypothetical protein